VEDILTEPRVLVNSQKEEPTEDREIFRGLVDAKAWR